MGRESGHQGTCRGRRWQAARPRRCGGPPCAGQPGRPAALPHPLRGVDAIVASACAHHRLLWIHPFLDGNGRVARLMSYAMQRETLDTEAFGPSRAALPATRRPTSNILLPVTCSAATIWTVAAR
ncbi:MULTISPECIES: Fic family protein [unclassified Bradyrhizobium]